MSSYNKITKTDLADGALYEKVNDMVDALNADKIERSQVGIRKGSTAYKVGDKCFCEYHGDFLLECTTAGTSAVGQLDTSGTVTDGATRTDGSVVWTFRSVATKKELNDVKNSSLDKTQITNCITYIPQDIKLELADGTLTLKAGSKVYVPNGKNADGSLKFDVVVFTADQTYTGGDNGVFFVALGSNKALCRFNYKSVSGTIEPENKEGLVAWYDTTSNVMKRYISGAWDYPYSLPVAIITVSNGAISSIDQVFNGFGYIGSTVFALPGVKGLMPNGRNDDGSLKNSEITLSKVVTKEIESVLSGKIVCVLGKNELISRALATNYSYDANLNKIFWFGNSSSIVKFVDFTATNGIISNFQPKTTFHAVDYNDFVDLEEKVDTKQDIATAVNYDNITNCITYIPQDIKLELNNGVLALKAGSKVYVPNGAGKFDVVTTASDIYIQGNESSSEGVVKKLIIISTANNTYEYRYNLENCYSGTTAPTNINTQSLWYDTANNIIKRTMDGGVTWISDRKICLPLGIFTREKGAPTSIDQVFNGFGYIGSTVFALPGVKGLIPNGRNEDGTLKNTTVSIDSVQTITQTGPYKRFLRILANGTLTSTIAIVEYNEEKNENVMGTTKQTLVDCGTCEWDASNKITSLQPKTTFHAVDYNDFAPLKDVGTSKQDIATAVNYDNITNCITEIPQDIKVRYSGTSVYVEVGSKIYYCDGNFTTETTKNNELYATFSSSYTGSYVIFAQQGSNRMIPYSLSSCYSGSTAPDISYKVWFNTSDNKMYIYTSGEWKISGVRSLPLAIVSVSSGTVVSIDQVFNGFGYIGSTVFTLPGVKSLISNGRNADGTLKSIEKTTTQVKIRNEAPYSSELAIFDGTELFSYGVPNYFEQDTTPTGFGTHAIWVNTRENKIYQTTDGGSSWFVTYKLCLGKLIKQPNANITKLSLKNTFHAVDYNDAVKYSDKSTIVGWGIPDYTAGVSKSKAVNYTAEKAGYVLVRAGASGQLPQLTITVNGVALPQMGYTGTAGGLGWGAVYVDKGDIYRFDTPYNDNIFIMFFPLKGAV